MPPDRHLAAGGVADMDGVFQVEMRRKSGQIVGVMIHIVSLRGLSGAAMATPVMGRSRDSHDAGRTATVRPRHPRMPAVCPAAF